MMKVYSSTTIPPTQSDYRFWSANILTKVTFQQVDFPQITRLISFCRNVFFLSRRPPGLIPNVLYFFSTYLASSAPISSYMWKETILHTWSICYCFTKIPLGFSHFVLVKIARFYFLLWVLAIWSCNAMKSIK